jgi:alkane 1-monooxygenase
VAVHFFTLAAFFFYIEPSNEPWSDTLGKTLAMGMMCGVFGINIGHELGHRVNKIEQFIAQLMLLTSQYTHFFIEHNEGHHRNVGTPGDPASAVKNEVLYVFVLRGMPRTYLAAWQIEKKAFGKKENAFYLSEEQDDTIQFDAIGFDVWYFHRIRHCVPPLLFAGSIYRSLFT